MLYKEIVAFLEQIVFLQSYFKILQTEDHNAKGHNYRTSIHSSFLKTGVISAGFS